MKTLVLNRPALLETAAERIAALVEKKPNAVIGLSAEEPALSVYALLAERCRQGALSLSKVRFFTVTEFDGLDSGSEHNRGQKLKAFFTENTDADARLFTVLEPSNWEQYEVMLAACGGLDLAIPELGVNSRVGFNEPATPFDTRTHRQKLTNPTRRELAAEFGGEDRVPVYGLTMGIKTLVEATELLVLAEGEDKARAVFHMLYGRDDSIYPAAFLQIPLQVTVLVDEAAASKL